MSDFMTDLDAGESAPESTTTTSTTSTKRRRTKTTPRGRRSKATAAAAEGTTTTTTKGSPKQPRKRRKKTTPVAATAAPASVCVDAGAASGAPAMLNLTSGDADAATAGAGGGGGSRRSSGKAAASTKASAKPAAKTRKRRAASAGKGKKAAASTSTTTTKTRAKRPRTTTASTASETPAPPPKATPPPSSSRKAAAEAKRKALEEPLRPARMSETVSAMRDTARKGMPADVTERLFTSDSVSYLSADPTREEEKATLASMASGPGTPLSAVTGKEAAASPAKEPPKKKAKTKSKRQATVSSARVVSRGPTTTTTKSRSRGRRRSSAKSGEPVVHQLKDLPTTKEWGPQAPSEAQAATGQLPETREIGKHPGKVKTAGMGVAVPPPGARESHLRRQLDASAMSRSGSGVKHEQGSAQEAAAKGTASVHEGRWETETVAQVASRLDQQRMDVVGGGGGGGGEETLRPARPLAELRKIISDPERLTLSDARTRLGRYMSALVEQQLLELDQAARLVRARNGLALDRANAFSSSAGLPDSSQQQQLQRHQRRRALASKGSAPSSAARRARRGAGQVLLLDDDEADILDAMCGPLGLRRSSLLLDGDDLIDAPADATADASLRCALPRVGLGTAIDMPLDEIEVAVLTGSSLRDAMVYFMSFDDSVKAMERVYDSVTKLASLPPQMDALRKRISPIGMPNQDRDEMVRRLAEYERELDAEWQNQVASMHDDSGADKACGPSDPKLLLSETWVRRNSVRVLGAILTGELDGQRHNIVRSLVEREEALLGLYREPAMRCFINDGRQAGGHSTPGGVQANGGGSNKNEVGADASRGPQAGYADTDVLHMMRRMLQGDSANGGGDGSAPDRLVMPDLGTAAPKAYCADFLRAPDPDRSLERPCVHGERGCIAWILAAHAAWPATGALNRATHAFVMREFYAPDRWERIVKDRSLPDEQSECLLCARMTATYYWIQLRLLDSRGVVGLQDELRGERYRGTLLGQSHCNAIEPESGYTESDMLPVCKPTDGPWTGIIQPIVAFRANAYVPGECVAPIDLSRPQRQQQQSSTGSGSGSGGGASDKPAPRTLSCFYERTAADFH